MSLFEILNMSMSQLFVLADDPTEALAVAKKVRHLRRSAPRRMRDVTDACLEEDATGTLKKLLAGTDKGVIVRSDKGWSFAT